jgi:hypothetical protein
LLRAASVLETHGPEVAEHVASFETRQIDAIRDLVQQEDIDCDFEEGQVTDVCLYKEGREQMKTSLARISKANVSTAKGIRFSPDGEAEMVRKCARYHCSSEGRQTALIFCLGVRCQRRSILSQISWGKTMAIQTGDKVT